MEAFYKIYSYKPLYSVQMVIEYRVNFILKTYTFRKDGLWLFENINDITLYPTGQCNLHCKYCYLAENMKSKLTEEKLAKSFEGDYYINFIKEVLGDNIVNIETLDLWGGEVPLALDRVFGTLKSLIKECPNLNTILIPTNCTNDKLLENLKKLIDLLGNVPNRQFTIHIEGSLDGPKYINDMNRGEGTTDLFFEYYEKLLKEKFYINDYFNIRIRWGVNATLSPETMRCLTSKNALAEYYKFFETSLFDPYINLMNQDNRFTPINTFISPNIAEPYMYTQEDGFILAQICKLSREMELEGLLDKYNIKYHPYITPFLNDHPDFMDKLNSNSYDITSTFCSFGTDRMGFLPDNKLGGCIKNFSNDSIYKYSDDKNLVQITKDSTPFIFNDLNEYGNFYRIAEYDGNWKKSCVHGNSNLIMYVSLIKSLASSGLIDKELLDESKALRAGLFMMYYTGVCFTDSISISGTPIIPYIGRLKLYLNGAYKYIIDGSIWLMNKGRC